MIKKRKLSKISKTLYVNGFKVFREIHGTIIVQNAEECANFITLLSFIKD